MFSLGSKLCKRNELPIDRELTYNKVMDKGCNIIAIMRDRTPTHPSVYGNGNEGCESCKTNYFDFGYHKNKFLNGTIFGTYDNIEDAKQDLN